MGRFSDYIPPDFLANLNTEKFVKVLDLLHLEKTNQVDRFNRLFDHRLNTSVDYLRKYVIEITGWDLPPGMPKKLLENILYGAEDLFEFKGTKRGLELLFKILTDGDVLIDLGNYQPQADYIQLTDEVNGYLPSDPDYEILTGAADGTFLYLFESDLSSTYGTIEIRVLSPYAHVKQLRDFIESIIYEFVPFADENTLDIDIKYFNYVYLSDSGMKNFTHGY